MMENFLNHVKSRYSLSDHSFHEFSKICRIQSLKKDDFVLKEYSVCQDIYFVSKGLLRIFYYKEDKDISEWFAFENTFCFSIVSYFQSSPSKLIIQCLEDSDVVFIAREGLDNLRNFNFEIANMAYKLVSGSLIASQDRMASIQFETALTRYQNLILQHKDFLQRIPLNFIASFLGISAETLSRIRAQVN